MPKDALIGGEGAQHFLAVFTDFPISHDVGLDLKVFIASEEYTGAESGVIHMTENTAFSHHRAGFH